MKTALFVITALTVLVTCTEPLMAERIYKLKKNQLAKVAGKQCGLIGNKWRPVTKKKKAFVIDKRGGKRCASLLTPATLKRSGLASIPSASELLKSRAQSSALAVSGDVPAVKDIPTLGVKEVFWTPGFIDSLTTSNPPTQQQCGEFFHGSSDGQSGGMLGCYAIQGVAFAFQSILEGGNSACFMKNVPTAQNLASGGVEVVDGSLPGGDITKLFSVPSGSQGRVVKVTIRGFGGQDKYGYIRIDGQAVLDRKGLQYAHKLWFCDEGRESANNYEETSVSLTGEYRYSNVFVEGPNRFKNEIAAALVKVDSGLSFDTARERVARATGEFQGAHFKSLITLLPNNTLTSKVKESFNNFGRSYYSVAEFSGSGISDFAVRAAAVNNVMLDSSQEAGIEYRDTMYVSAPAIALKDELAKVDIATDAFYDESADVEPDFSDTSCSQDADVTLQMDFSIPSMQAIGQQCQGQQLRNMDFCLDEELVGAFIQCQL
jgi:hypothetical protein